MKKRLTLVLGGVRAGKSSYAQALAESGRQVLFVATAEAGDREMEARIQAHRKGRPADWDTLEEPVDLVSAVKSRMRHYDTVLLDCLTLWTSNLMLSTESPGTACIDIASEARTLLGLYREGNASWIVVSNEVGLGVVPATRLGRVYADELGRVNQIIAAKADDVYFMAAGLPLKLKTGGRGLDVS
ncbi:MAG: bifunctional adenosylcobinamide kinase/adenosylcobinamide-phosphate guanylyltransferase [Chloroflexi bacterium]|nr:bifunctional adenosylcobinamide kinase/adenosylcobinamide-phosphate guanylyltransferase [Chloroflexota bacterium]MCY3937078.1 bifunctional adenosylcobinamide kinase/adenosylcobinamide-phosphate guanylyltransferase [Chloroflexota bacterium]